ncbi:MAG: hypothetical protein C5B56_14445 [Proteobacteria bacterium]|nr:MAG: hypothetical protein C5B56_14445 [Pseudomonadota bacterium]
MLRTASLVVGFGLTLAAPAAEIESRALTHYIPQDLLESIIRKEGWAEIVLKPYGGVRKGDKARIWAGGLIDRGGGAKPGSVVAGPAGPTEKVSMDTTRLTLSSSPEHAYAILFKSDEGVPHKCLPPGKPLEIPLTKEGARLWMGFNDERGRFMDNHLGKGLRHELDPAWVRVEVIRIIVD